MLRAYRFTRFNNIYKDSDRNLNCFRLLYVNYVRSLFKLAKYYYLLEINLSIVCYVQ